MYPKQRLDALTDGIYAVAMTLLVLDIRIPDNVTIASNAELIKACLALWSKAIPYVISFFVLASGWLSQIRIRFKSESVGKRYTTWWQLQLLLVTLVPFSNLLLGRYFEFSFAVAVYAANIGLMALSSYRMLAVHPDVEADESYRNRRTSLLVLMASCAATLALSPVLQGDALYAMLLNAATPAFIRRNEKRKVG